MQHAAGFGAKSAPVANCTYPTNPLYAGPVLRALLVALDEWIAIGKPPPASRYPSRRDGTLVEATAEKVAFPKVPGFDFKGTMMRPSIVNHTVMPPAKAEDYPVYVPKLDADGNDIAGVRLPTLVAPIGTHVGWNVRKEGFANGALCGNFGSMLPFANTREERLKSNDPRLSLEERYPSSGDREAAIARASQQLVLTGCCSTTTRSALSKQRTESWAISSTSCRPIGCAQALAGTACAAPGIRRRHGSGRSSGAEILTCHDAGIAVTLPKPMTSGIEAKGRFGKQDFVYLSDPRS